MTKETLEAQVKAIFDAAQKKALALGGNAEAHAIATTEAAQAAVTVLAIELDNLRSRDAQRE
jgi:hypothetical protein